MGTNGQTRWVSAPERAYGSHIPTTPLYAFLRPCFALQLPLAKGRGVTVNRVNCKKRNEINQGVLGFTYGALHFTRGSHA
jgi:hypothetical protein